MGGCESHAMTEDYRSQVLDRCMRQITGLAGPSPKEEEPTLPQRRKFVPMVAIVLGNDEIICVTHFSFKQCVMIERDSLTSFNATVRLPGEPISTPTSTTMECSDAHPAAITAMLRQQLRSRVDVEKIELVDNSSDNNSASYTAKTMDDMAIDLERRVHALVEMIYTTAKAPKILTKK